MVNAVPNPQAQRLQALDKRAIARELEFLDHVLENLERRREQTRQRISRLHDLSDQQA